MNASRRNIPPHHQLALVRRFPVCLVPKNELAELLTPPKVAANPCPCPLCSKTAAIKMRLSIVRSTIRIEYSMSESRVRVGVVSYKYHET
jgi:hypothetical protein